MPDDSVTNAVKKAAEEVQATADAALDEGVRAAKSALSWVAAFASEGCQALDSSKKYVDSAAEVLNEQQDKAFAHLKGGVEYLIAHPEVSYPLAAAATVAALPPLRRLLYRATLGRLRSPEAVAAGAEQRLGVLGARIQDYGKETEKLQARALAAHDEWTRGYTKLKAARAELQRLSAAVSKAERAAAGVLDDVRSLSSKGQPKVIELRAEAAQKLAAARQQHAVLRKEVRWISKLDV